MSKLLTYGIMQQKRKANLLLDTYSGAACAWSLRKLKSDYTGNCIKVRRSSDDTEQEIGFSNGVLNESALTTFVGASDGYVTKWYDQSGNGNDMIGGVYQPKIVISGTVQSTNGKPAIYNWVTNTTVAAYMITSNSVNIGTTISTFMVAYSESNSGYTRLLNGWTDIYFFLGAVNGDVATFYGNGSSWGTVTANSTTDWYNNQRLVTTINTGNDNQFINGNTITARSNAMGSFNNKISIAEFGVDIGVNQAWLGFYQEIIIWASDKSTYRSNIESNINDFYSIY